MTNEQKALNVALAKRGIERKELHKHIGAASPATGYARLRKPDTLTIREARLLKLSDEEITAIYRGKI